MSGLTMTGYGTNTMSTRSRLSLRAPFRARLRQISQRMSAERREHRQDRAELRGDYLEDLEGLRTDTRTAMDAAATPADRTSAYHTGTAAQDARQEQYRTDLQELRAEHRSDMSDLIRDRREVANDMSDAEIAAGFLNADGTPIRPPTKPDEDGA